MEFPKITIQDVKSNDINKALKKQRNVYSLSLMTLSSRLCVIT